MQNIFFSTKNWILKHLSELSELKSLAFLHLIHLHLFHMGIVTFVLGRAALLFGHVQVYKKNA